MDLVERLRGYIAYNTKQSREEDDVMRDAAHEIERLREEVQTAFDKGYRAAGGEIFPILIDPK